MDGRRPQGVEVRPVLHPVTGEPLPDGGAEPQFLIWQGPLPPPFVLEGYERLAPGAAKRFFDGMHDEQEHRHGQERLVLEEKKEARVADNRHDRHAQNCAAGTVAGCFVLAAVALGVGQPWIGAAFGLAGASPVVAAFLRPRERPRRDGENRGGHEERS